MCATYTHVPCRLPRSLWPVVRGQLPSPVWALMAGPPGLPGKEGAESREHAHAHLSGPRQGLGKTEARATRPPIAPRIKKGSLHFRLHVYV